MQIDNPGIWRLIFPGEEELSRLGADERLAIQYTYFVMNFFKSLYLNYRDGVIDDERWKTWDSWISYSLVSSTTFRNVWRENCWMYHADFVAHVEDNFDDGVCGDGSAMVNVVGPPITASSS
jgi:hypothetical protein